MLPTLLATAGVRFAVRPLATPVAPSAALAVAPAPIAAFDTLRALRASRPPSAPAIVSAAQLEPGLAAALTACGCEFDVPTTMRGAASMFFAHPTPRLIVALLALSLAVRVGMGVPAGLADAAVAAATSIGWWLQEWVLHDKLLHSQHSWFGEQIHRRHHDLPYFHVSIDGVQLAAAWFVSVALLLAATAAAGALSAPLGATALVFYTLWGGVYEWSHFLAHTRVPLRGHWARVRAQHTLHHVHSDEYWLAFCLPGLDSVLGTSPRPGDVPRMAGGGQGVEAKRSRRAPQYQYGAGRRCQ